MIFGGNIIMKNCRFFLVLIGLTLGQVSCLNRKKSTTTQAFHYTGVSIAVNNLIEEYEKEHQAFYEEECKNGDCLEWLDMDNKNLSNFCKKYLQYSTPTRSTENAIGVKIVKPLHYVGKNSSINITVAMVHCKVRTARRVVSYYATQSPLPNCVYALKCTVNNSEFIFNIINKYCNFEDKPLIICKSLRPKRAETINKIHSTTGEPIAKDEYLWQYELEHQDMVKNQGKDGLYIEWPYAMVHHDLDSFCYHYMRKCAPARNRKDVKGSWKTENLHYQKLNTIENIIVIIVSCLPSNVIKRHYYFTRAPEANCVYALLRQGKHTQNPLVIKFKHCDFEDPDD